MLRNSAMVAKVKDAAIDDDWGLSRPVAIACPSQTLLKQQEELV